MADREVTTSTEEVPEMPEILERVLLYALEEGKKKMDQGEELAPFTTLVVKDSVFLESHPGNSSQECFNLARHTVEGARGADAYALCYDGYIETDEGVRDALIAEGGIPGTEQGHAIGYLYTQVEDAPPVFDDSPSYIGESPNFMVNLRDASEYADADIDEKYVEGEQNV